MMGFVACPQTMAKEQRPCSCGPNRRSKDSNRPGLLDAETAEMRTGGQAWRRAMALELGKASEPSGA